MHNMHKLKLHNAVEGVFPNGNATYTAAAAILKGQPLKFDGTEVTPCTAATDDAIGVALDGAAAGEIVPVAILGAFTGTVLLYAGAAIDAGAQITATGVATSGATDVIIGRALEAAAGAGSLVNIAHQVGHVK